MIVDAIDTYFMYIKQQMALIDPTIRFGGLVNARDWPQDQVNEGVLYLLYMSSNQQLGGSKSQLMTENFCQWMWILIGTDIQANQRAQNRGDRYRINMKLENVLRQANFPGFTQKLSYTADPTTGVVTGAPVASTFPASSEESIWWTGLRFIPRLDNEKSGVTYGAAAVSVYCYDDVLASLATP